MQKIIWIPAALVLLAGCGDVDWFPETVKGPTTPNFFSFAAKSDVALGSTVTSDAITVSGISSGSAPLAVSGDSTSKYLINGAASTAMTIKNNETVAVQHTAASERGKSVKTTLKIGDKSADFISTTLSVAPFEFASQTGVELNTPIYSNPLTISAATAGPFKVTVSGGEYAVAAAGSVGNCSALIGTIGYTSIEGTASNGQIVCVRMTSSSTSVTPQSMSLTVGGVNGTFKVTTR